MKSLGMGGQENLKYLPKEIMFDMITPKMKWNKFYPKADGNNFSANLQTTSNNQVELDKKHFEVDRYILAEALSNDEELGRDGVVAVTKYKF